MIYNFYFGWNDEPINRAEEICDSIRDNGFLIGIIIYCLPIFSLYESMVAKNDKEKQKEEFFKEENID